MIVKLKNKKITLKPFTLGDVVKIQDEHKIDIFNMGERVSAQALAVVLYVGLSKVDPEVSLSDVYDLSLTDAVFEPKTLNFLIGGVIDKKVKN